MKSKYCFVLRVMLLLLQNSGGQKSGLKQIYMLLSKNSYTPYVKFLWHDRTQFKMFFNIVRIDS